jgi:hypothetical protein
LLFAEVAVVAVAAVVAEPCVAAVAAVAAAVAVAAAHAGERAAGAKFHDSCPSGASNTIAIHTQNDLRNH